ncbi:MAG: hypothetical protein XD60_1486 [Acetothermia bacterium 64_32]|nr:MAG: hypothetical protein XD60_1486 [Acetothermia bacterium 64_32]HAF70322.1 hypothetical protein [Candidatus Acetothermia bacterium]
MNWRRKVEREYLEADQEFAEQVLPVGSVDLSSFGLIADATRYLLVEERGEVHIRPETVSLKEVLTSLARGGSQVNERDAAQAVARFAALWEEKIRAKGKWEELVAAARAAGEIKSPQKRRGWFRR